MRIFVLAFLKERKKIYIGLTIEIFTSVIKIWSYILFKNKIWYFKILSFGQVISLLLI